MSRGPSLKKNYAYNLVYQVLALVVPFVTIPYVSRVLGAGGVGTYSFSLSVVTYFMLAAALGVQGYGAREVSRTRDNRGECSTLFWEIAAMVGATTLVCCAAWVMVSFAVADYTLYFLAFLPMLTSVAFDISWLYIGLEKMAHVVVRNSAVKLAGLALLFVFVRTPDDLVPYILVNSLVQLAGCASMWVTLPGIVARPRIRMGAMPGHFKETLVYFVPALATSLYTVLDKTLIGVMTGDPLQNGYYEQADKVVRMAMTLSFTSVNLVMGARLAYLFEKGKTAEARDRALRALDFMLLLAFGFAFGIAAVADSFVPLFFGEGYGPVIPLLRLMCPLIVVIAVSNCLGSQYYTPSGRRAQSARYIVVGAVANVGLSFALIPPFGMYGALAGSLAAEVVITALYVGRCDGFLSFGDIWARAWKRLIAGAAATSAALLFTISPMQSLLLFFAQFAGFCMIYVGLLALMRDGVLRMLVDGAVRRLGTGV